LNLLGGDDAAAAFFIIIAALLDREGDRPSPSFVLAALPGPLHHRLSPSPIAHHYYSFRGIASPGPTNRNGSFLREGIFL